MWLCRYRPLVASGVGHGLNLFLCSDHRLAVRNDSKRQRLAGGGGGEVGQGWRSMQQHP
jgi:hypothetical protein